MSGTADSGLLSKDALSGVRLGISVSPSPDLPRLGLIESHFRLVLAEITRCVLVSGGHLAYGGHLDPKGYTAFMVHELERYNRRDRPLHVCLSWSEHRKLSLTRLKSEKKRLGLYGEIIYLDPDGNVVEPASGREEDPPGPLDVATTARSLTNLRYYMAEHTHGRVFVGGRREGFKGEMPGLLEEAILSLEQEQPIYLAGGLGGITYDIAKALDVNTGDWFPGLGNTSQVDERVVKGMVRLTETARATKGRSLDNGLTTEENQQLAACHRPSEIAALISLGLGRRFAPT